MTQYKKNPNRIGGLWVNHGQDRDGRPSTWLSGMIELPDGSKMGLNVYKTTKKHSEKSPDFAIYKKKPKQEQAPVSNEPDVPFEFS